MRTVIYSTFDLFFESYLEDFIEMNKYETVELQQYNYHLLFEYGTVFKHLPFNDDELEAEKKYIEDKFGFFSIIFLMQDYDFKDRMLTLENTRKISKILRKECGRVASYLKNEILKTEIEKNKANGKELKGLNSVFQYSLEVQKYANAFFKGDLSKLKLLEYFSENFSSTNEKFNDLTKYNHIYRYFNEQETSNLEKTAYKNLIRELFRFEYGNREIKGNTLKYIEQLENLAIQYQITSD